MLTVVDGVTLMLFVTDDDDEFCYLHEGSINVLENLKILRIKKGEKLAVFVTASWFSC